MLLTSITVTTSLQGFFFLGIFRADHLIPNLLCIGDRNQRKKCSRNTHEIQRPIRTDNKRYKKTHSLINDYLANLLDTAFANAVKSGSKELRLPEAVDILSGGTPKTKNVEYWEDGKIPFFTPRDVTNSVYTLTTEKHITDFGLNNCNSELYPVDTVFLTARGTVGKVAIAERPMAMNQSCFAFRGNGIPQSIVFQIIKNAVKSLRAKANGATFAAINTRDLKIETVKSHVIRRLHIRAKTLQNGSI